MNDAELNQRLSDLDDDHPDIVPTRLLGTGKVLPYYGWFWRAIDFERFLLADARDAKLIAYGSEVPGWVGFCQSNKWNYPTFVPSHVEGQTIRLLCETLVTVPTKDAATSLFEYLQTLRG